MDDLTAELNVSLRDFDLGLAIRASAGAPVAIVGPSGSGKTTALRAIAGLVRPTRGTIQLGSRILYDSDRGIDLPPEQRACGFVFQDYALFPHLSARRNVAYGSRGSSLDIDELLRAFGISHLAEQRPPQLSGGERQRVALARALARSPRLMLLDEPTAALDVATRSSVIGTLAAMLHSTGVPTLVVSHSFEEASILADHVVVIERGSVVQSGTAEAIRADPASSFVAHLTGMNVLHGRSYREDGSDLTTIQTTAGARLQSTMLLPGPMPVAVLIAPTEITLDTSPPHGSTLNVVDGPITSLVRTGNTDRIRVGGLVVDITTQSNARLGLAVGTHVFASFKATNTRLLPAGPSWEVGLPRMVVDGS